MSRQNPAALCIIADDLTGALDAAAPFAGRGLSVQVALSPEALPQALATAPDVVAVNTASREGSIDAARDAILRVRALLPAGIRIFKKVDSRLKGHVAGEVAALAPHRLLVAPALPEFGRFVRDGHVAGFGVERPIPVAAALGDLAPQATIPDTETAEQMSAALAAAPSDALLVGARGLAEALAVRMTGRATATPARAQAAKALIAVGSRDPITLAQVDTLRAARAVDWRPAPLGVLPPGPAGGALTLVQAVPGDHMASGDAVAAALAASLHPALTAGADLLFLTGGATAEAVLAAMGIGLLSLAGECFPGVPLAHAGGRAIITKSGGFGGPGLLLDLAAQLEGSHPCR